MLCLFGHADIREKQVVSILNIIHYSVHVFLFPLFKPLDLLQHGESSMFCCRRCRTPLVSTFRSPCGRAERDASGRTASALVGM